MPDFWLQNLTAHWFQAGVLSLGAAAVAAALRLRHPAVRLLFWQAVLVICVALPLVEPWQSAPAIAAAPATVRVDVSAAQESVAASLVPRWPAVIPAAIATGIVLRLGWIGLGFVRLRALRRSLRTDVAGRVADIDAALGEIGVSASIRVAGRAGPLNFGLAPPMVVLPESWLTLDSESRRAVLLHELIHVRRRDWLAALVEELLLAVIWFHPWAWWTRAQIRLAREETVDREVVARIGGRDVYAACLLTMAGYDAAAFPAAVTLLRPRELRHRLEALFQEVAMSRARLTLVVVLLGVALLAFTTAGVTAFPLTREGVGSGAGQAPPQAVTARRIVQLVPPEYPADALQEGIGGTVVVEITVNAAGDVSGFAVVSGPNELQNSAITALRQWRFGKAPTADVLVAELGYQINVRNDRRLPGWSFVLGTKDAAAETPGVIGGVVGGVVGGVPGGISGGVPGGVTTSTPAETPLRVGGNVKPPRKIKDVRPVYPSDARDAKVQGIVIIETTIGSDGRVTRTKIMRSIPALDQAARDAVQQWEFEPVLLNGVPTPVVMVVTIQFSL